MLRFQHYKGCYCLPLLIQGEILGPNSPQRYSPGSHLRLRKAGSAHRCTLTALPGRVTPTCVNTADIYSHAEAPARYRVLLEVTGQLNTGCKALLYHTAIGCTGQRDFQSRETMPNQVCPPACFPPSLGRPGGHPKPQPEPCLCFALDCEHPRRYCTCCIHQLHSSEPAGY